MKENKEKVSVIKILRICLPNCFKEIFNEIKYNLVKF